MPGEQIEFDVVGLFASFDLAVFSAFTAATALFAGEHVDTLGVDRGEEIVQVIRRGYIAGQQIVDLPIGQIAFFFAGIDEFIDVFFVLVEFFSPRSRALPARDLVRLGFRLGRAHSTAHREDSLRFTWFRDVLRGGKDR